VSSQHELEGIHDGANQPLVNPQSAENFPKDAREGPTMANEGNSEEFSGIFAYGIWGTVIIDPIFIDDGDEHSGELEESST
jgi:hypothetical protein